MTPRVTTIVPTYRRPVLLKRAVLSVLNQSSADFVVQILDNASGDETGQVARELMRMDSRVAYHCHDTNIGSLQNMIYGMEHVTTPYFSILCDDDLLMPDFFKAGLDAHERDSATLAFVAARVIVVDEAGRFRDPWTHPHEACRFPPPDGVVRCVKHGASLPGVLYRTSAMRSIGAPRTAWWNWTESGWHALAAMQFPVEFVPAVGAVVFVHADSSSKRMDTLEFRTSWFRMLSELHAVATDNAVGASWWVEHVLPIARRRFLGTLFRMCGSEGSTTYETIGQLGTASGLNARGVSASIALARAVGALGAGRPLNAAVDWILKFRGQSASPVVSHEAGGDAGIDAASRVFSRLNRQSGVS